MTVIEEITSALEELPKDATLIAEFLGEQGIKGDYHIASCPVANYLKQKTGLLVQVGGRRVWAGTDRVVMPLTVTDFINRFDDNQFPALYELQ